MTSTAAVASGVITLQVKTTTEQVRLVILNLIPRINHGIK
jgi:hypothetical protein